jgi:hypothetical protein
MEMAGPLRDELSRYLSILVFFQTGFFILLQSSDISLDSRFPFVLLFETVIPTNSLAFSKAT